MPEAELEPVVEENEPFQPEPLPPPPFVPRKHSTQPDHFGVIHTFQLLPSRCPDVSKAEDLGDAPTFSVQPDPKSYLANSFLELADGDSENWYRPFESPSSFRLMNWYSESNGKLSLAHMDRLVDGVLKQDDFDVADLVNFHAQREAERLDKNDTADTSSVFASNVWTESSVTISLPKDGLAWKGEADAPTLEVKNIRWRSFIEVIQSAFQDSQFLKFSLAGFREFWKPSEDAPSDCLYGECFSADTFLEAELELLEQEQRGLDCLQSQSGTTSSTDSSDGSSSSSTEDSQSHKSNINSMDSSNSSSSSAESNSLTSASDSSSDNVLAW
ncbi:hypothetical protein VKT23_009867 [Stygiomarasmius scandens]|uniref:Uncharacterized protein n=1 Tax=Marasmiellus scandens TaxID=2682957 RepID=A0ABR1JE74_9AGAR